MIANRSKARAGNPDGFSGAGARRRINSAILGAKGFDDMLARVKKARCKWRQNDVPEIDLWQIFLLDPSGVPIELNFDTTKEPRGGKGPVERNIYDAGKFYAAARAVAATP